MIPESLTLQGGCFTTSKTLDLLKKPINVLYGRNGSGKSTIANAFRVLKGEDIEPTIIAQLGSSTLSEDDAKKIFVFDESFIRQNLLIEDSNSGLESIVMLGEQVDLSQQIQSKEQELADVNQELTKLNTEAEQYNDGENKKSPIYWRNKLYQSLRNGWAAEDRDIKGNTMLTHVTDSVIDNFRDMQSPTERIEDLKSLYSAKIQEFHAARKNQSRLAQLPADWTFPVELETINDLLSRVIDKPELSEREKRIIELLDKDSSQVSKMKEVFSNQKTETCPFCFQTVTESHKQGLCDSIEKVLNKEVEDFKQQVQKTISLLSTPSVDHSQEIQALFPTEWINFDDALKQYNDSITSLKNVLQARFNSPYHALESKINECEIVDKLKSLNEAKNALKLKISNHNQIVDALDRNKDKLLIINKKIAYLEYKATIEQIISQEGEQSKNDSKILARKIQKDQKEKELVELKSRLARIEIACDFINEALSYIFFSKDRIKLDPKDGKYIIQSNGVPVPPKKVSLGERNAIALCYFFANMFVGFHLENRYSQERLVVIDDPVSSFDQGNRMGIISFLRWQFKQIVGGNPESKCLIMTHDLLTAFDLCKLKNDIDGKKDEWLELKEETIIPQAYFHNRNEYAKLLHEVYFYATAENPLDEDTLNVGNQMRRVVEAYCSFKFNQKFEKEFKTQEFLLPIPEAKRSYYENLMYRLVLNGESHTEERVYALPPIEDLFSPKELQITAKSVLMMLYYVDRLHLLSYLSDVPGETTFKNWEMDNFDQLSS